MFTNLIRLSVFLCCLLGCAGGDSSTENGSAGNAGGEAGNAGAGGADASMNMAGMGGMAGMVVAPDMGSMGGEAGSSMDAELPPVTPIEQENAAEALAGAVSHSAIVVRYSNSSTLRQRRVWRLHQEPI